jgi:biotin carboxyl carrier protein
MIYDVVIDGKNYRLELERKAAEWICRLDGKPIQIDAVLARRGPQKLIAPMPGRIVRILVAEKSQVDLGQGLLVVEAMKMQNEIKSPKKGIVAKLAVAPGATVNAGDVLAIVE